MTKTPTPEPGGRLGEPGGRPYGPVYPNCPPGPACGLSGSPDTACADDPAFLWLSRQPGGGAAQPPWDLQCLMAAGLRARYPLDEDGLPDPVAYAVHKAVNALIYLEDPDA